MGILGIELSNSTVRKQTVSLPKYLSALLVLLLLAGFSSNLWAEDLAPRARFSNPEDTTKLRFRPLKLSGGSRLTLISPTEWSDVADDLMTTLDSTHGRYLELFGSIPSFATSIRLMNDREFYELTGAPTWTNAMFFRGQIIIPISAHQPIDLDNVQRSVRHEYTHAIISALSGARAPGWLDEGIAQWAEGSQNPALKPALIEWLTGNQPVPLRLLQGGFTKLNPNMVPAAYAQSLLAADKVMSSYGFKRIASYMNFLRAGFEKTEAFRLGFGVSEQQFETKLSTTLLSWASGATGHALPTSLDR